jgi:hypothetical protein
VQLKTNEEALVQVLEFLTTFTVFLLILAAFFSSIATQFPHYDTTNVTIRDRAEEISEVLISSPGYVKTEGGYDTSWEGPAYGEYEINLGANKLQKLGLARGDGVYGILSLAKVNALRNKIHYITIEEVLALEPGQLVNISIESLDGKITYLEKGGIRTESTRNYVVYTRIVLIDDGTGDLEPCRLSVHLFAGGIRPR